MEQTEEPTTIKEITEEIKETPTSSDKSSEDTTPFLTQEEEDFDIKMHADLPQEDDK